MDKRPFEPCSRFDFDRLYGRGKYGLQNMLLREVNMPTYVYAGEWVTDIWSDRCLDAFWNNAKLIESRYTADAFFAGATEDSFLKWATAVVADVEGKQIPITGAAVVRYTNVMSGYPVLRLTAIVATKNLETRNYGITSSRLDVGDTYVVHSDGMMERI